MTIQAAVVRDLPYQLHLNRNQPGGQSPTTCPTTRDAWRALGDGWWPLHMAVETLGGNVGGSRWLTHVDVHGPTEPGRYGDKSTVTVAVTDESTAAMSVEVLVAEDDSGVYAQPTAGSAAVVVDGAIHAYRGPAYLARAGLASGDGSLLVAEPVVAALTARWGSHGWREAAAGGNPDPAEWGHAERSHPLVAAAQLLPVAELPPLLQVKEKGLWGFPDPTPEVIGDMEGIEKRLMAGEDIHIEAEHFDPELAESLHSVAQSAGARFALWTR